MYAAGWYPDPARRFQLRYHNGSAWTADVSTDGNRFVDPMGLAPPSMVVPVGVAAARNGAATAALVLGIVAVATAWMPFVFAVGTVSAVIAIPLAILGRRRSAVSGRRRMATAGLVLGIVALLLSIIGFLFTRLVYDFATPGENSTEITGCRVRAGVATAEGTLQNLEDGVESFVVVVEFLDADGDQIDQDFVSVDDVPGGASVAFVASKVTSADEVTCTVSEVLGGSPVPLD